SEIVGSKGTYCLCLLSLMGILIFEAVYHYRSNAMEKQERTTNGGKEIADRVKRAFEIARNGDFGPSSDLKEFGQAIVPHLAPYIKDPNEDIRRQVIALLKLTGSEAALPLLAMALVDSVEDIQKRAALVLYERYDPAVIT